MIYLLVIFTISCVACGVINIYDKIEFRSDYIYSGSSSQGYWYKVHPEPEDSPTAYLSCFYEGADSMFPLSPDFLKETGLGRKTSHNSTKPKAYEAFSKALSHMRGQLEDILAGVDWDAPTSECFQGSFLNGFLWNFTCAELYPFVCYKQHVGNRVNECGTIDNAYKLEASGHCYKYHVESARWEGAQKACRAEGGYLAVINSADEAEILNEVMYRAQPLNTSDLAWIGYRKWGKGADSWWTINGQTLKEAGFDTWCGGCPYATEEAKGGELFCGGFSNGVLEDVSCTEGYPFICEKRTDSLTISTNPYSY